MLKSIYGRKTLTEKRSVYRAEKSLLPTPVRRVSAEAVVALAVKQGVAPLSLAVAAHRAMVVQNERASNPPEDRVSPPAARVRRKAGKPS